MMNLDFERPMETLADVEKLRLFPLDTVRRWVCMVAGLNVRKFDYHRKMGYFPPGKVKVPGENELWYDDAGVQEILDLCKARGWLKK